MRPKYWWPPDLRGIWTGLDRPDPHQTCSDNHYRCWTMAASTYLRLTGKSPPRPTLPTSTGIPGARLVPGEEAEMAAAGRGTLGT